MVILTSTWQAHICLSPPGLEPTTIKILPITLILTSPHDHTWKLDVTLSFLYHPGQKDRHHCVIEHLHILHDHWQPTKKISHQQWFNAFLKHAKVYMLRAKCNVKACIVKSECLGSPAYFFPTWRVQQANIKASVNLPGICCPIIIINHIWVSF